ncbi:hypothetical protein SDJN02_16175, partial [Cucurbita argyrosperma subsp. argyrosperma]
MGPTDALQDAIESLTLQCVDLSGDFRLLFFPVCRISELCGLNEEWGHNCVKKWGIGIALLSPFQDSE